MLLCRTADGYTIKQYNNGKEGKKVELGFNNPLREGLRLRRVAEPCAVVIFGASGDLTKRKLIPALYSLARKNLLAAGFSVIGAARTPMTHDQFRGAMREANAQYNDAGLVHDIVWENFAAGLFYNSTDYRADDSFARLGELLAAVDAERGTAGNRLFYLSTPPAMFGPIIRKIEAHGLSRPTNGGWTRIIVEKPFGLDLVSARELNRQILSVFSENQVYRIDHYLGKETVQNIMVLRFANGIFEPLWNRNYIDHVQITAAESIGVEGRGEFYEQAGALRDMIQNHMIQLLALVAMEPPASLGATAIRNEKTKVLEAIRPFPPGEIADFAVRGQYGSGRAGREIIRAYREEPSVDARSKTETYAAVKILIDNWRWAKVPFYLRSGKRLPKRVTEIAIQFKNAPHLLFKDNIAGGFASNALVIRVQPDEGISLNFNAKAPGQFVDIRPVSMDFSYTAFGQKAPEAYARLLLDAMLGDSTLFARDDMVEKTWELFTPVLDAWRQADDEPARYEPGSWGPSAADAMLARDGRAWREP